MGGSAIPSFTFSRSQFVEIDPPKSVKMNGKKGKKIKIGEKIFGPYVGRGD